MSSDTPVPASAAVLQGRYARLRPVTPGDYPMLFQMALSDEALVSWRFRGTTPSLEEFVGRLWDNVLCQFIIEPRGRDESLGCVVAFAADHRNGHCHLGVLFAPGDGPPFRMEGAALMLRYLFSEFPIRKVYVETLEFNLSKFQSAEGLVMHREGQLERREFAMGRWWDLIILAAYRETIEALPAYQQ